MSTVWEVAAGLGRGFTELVKKGPDRRDLSPPGDARWYSKCMSGTYQVVMGDRGRLVVPVELRERWGLRSGSTLLLVETPDALLVTTREQVKRLPDPPLQGSTLGEGASGRQRQD